MFKRIMVLVLLGGLFFVALQFTGVLFYAWEFDDFAADEVKFAPLREKNATNAQLAGFITEQARSYGLDLDDKDIDVNKKTDTESGITTLSVNVVYTVPVDLYYFTVPLKRHLYTATRY